VLVTNEIKDAFAGRENIPIYPSAGNHDTWPVNTENWDGPKTNKAILDYSDAWAQWIGREAAVQFQDYGYCSIPFRLADGTEIPNSRVLVMNTQAMNLGNMYLAGYKYDPGMHLTWLQDTLAELEAAGGIAYLIGHIQPFEYSVQFGERY
jgi:hypothetical protein